jgi:hypothetical protein
MDRGARGEGRMHMVATPSECFRAHDPQSVKLDRGSAVGLPRPRLTSLMAEKS